jgi:predicted metalloprotease
MQWVGRRQSSNVEDRRGFPTRGVAAGGGILGLVAIIVTMLLGGDPGSLLPQGGPDGNGGTAARREASSAEEQQKQFVQVVLADTEDVWNELFRQQVGKDYPEPTLVFFSGGSQSGCGFASSATGPFYCPMDQKVYLDLQFFNEMASRFRAAGDFAQAYVVAHEVGHHVQKQLGVLDQVNSNQRRMGQAEANRLSVRLELQADYLAGVWAHHDQKMKNILDPGDIDEALRAATAIGDDRLQKQARGYVVPDSFTHGTSEQRTRWFRRGYETGDMSKMMDTFKVSYDQL